MRGIMVNKIGETFPGHSSMKQIIHRETWPTDREGRDHHREEQLEERAALRPGCGFSICRITMSREFYRIKQLVRGSKRRQRTRLLCLSMPCRNGEKSSGRREPVDSKRFGSYLGMPAKRTTIPHKHWSWQLTWICLRILWLLALIKRVFITEFQSHVLMTQSITNRIINTRNWETRLSQ